MLKLWQIIFTRCAVSQELGSIGVSGGGAFSAVVNGAETPGLV